MLALLGGCVIGRVYRDKPLDEEAIAAIQRGLTTKSEILATFGPPQEIEARELVAIGAPFEPFVNRRGNKLPEEKIVGARYFRYTYSRANASGRVRSEERHARDLLRRQGRRGRLRRREGHRKPTPLRPLVTMTRQRRKLGLPVWAVAMALLCTGCTIGRVYRGAPLRGDPTLLVEGKSTKSDVLRLLGPPERITHQTDGDAFVYAYDRQNFSSITIQEPFTGQLVLKYNRLHHNRDLLVVLFDFGGTVRAVARESQTSDMPRL
jgi:outer membrane protein assembly factor BamE (lipoprotein component of BamABCDE complex)